VGHPIASVLALALALFVAEGVRTASTPVAALVLLVVAVLAAMVSSRVGPVALATGALAALAWALVRPLAPSLAGAALVTLVLAGRTLRVLAAPAQLLHVGLGVASGGLSAWATHTWLGGGLGWAALFRLGLTELAALTVAALVLGLPFLIDAERPEVHALVSLARRSRGPARMRLLRAVALARRSEGLVVLEPAERRVLRRALGELASVAERLVDAGARGPSLAAAVTPRVAALGRAVRALGRVEAAEHALEARATSATDLTAERAQLRHAVLASLDEPAPPAAP
jgi:hypothetical protein